MFTGATTGILAVPSTPGDRLVGPACDVSDSARSITVTFTPDAGHALADATAGSLSVNVIYLNEAALDNVLPLV